MQGVQSVEWRASGVLCIARHGLGSQQEQQEQQEQRARRLTKDVRDAQWCDVTEQHAKRWQHVPVAVLWREHACHGCPALAICHSTQPEVSARSGSQKSQPAHFNASQMTSKKSLTRIHNS